MPHVITQACCGDASCVYACPVNCIHPTPGEPDFGIAPMLYIDPATCVDCGACVSACPVGAIAPAHRLDADQRRFIEINADYYRDRAAVHTGARFPVDPAQRRALAYQRPARPLPGAEKVSVGIVGSGPSAMYAADELLDYRQVEVTVYEQLAQPYGLARYGVAPDHLDTRRVLRFFDRIARHPRLTLLVNSPVGEGCAAGDLADLRSRHDAVIWAGGAGVDRPLQLPGAELDNVYGSARLVGWYNGRPDAARPEPRLDGDRLVVIGNGNVALDIARVFAAEAESLAHTDIAADALAALQDSSIREVMVVGRRGPAQAAFTLPELIGLADGPVPMVVDPAELPGPLEVAGLDALTAMKVELLHELSARPAPQPGQRHIRLAFGRRPQRIIGDAGAVTGVEFAVGDGTETVPAALVATAIGFAAEPVPGLPFDAASRTVPHQAGRVIGEDGEPVPGMYVTGWIKRGPSGFIGTNKTDSSETVGSLLTDVRAGALTPAR